jgi:hypothetical protein
MDGYFASKTHRCIFLPISICLTGGLAFCFYFLQKIIADADRVIESFLDGVLSREARDQRLATIDWEIQIAQEKLTQEKPGALTLASAVVAEAA